MLVFEANLNLVPFRYLIALKVIKQKNNDHNIQFSKSLLSNVV